MRSNLKIQAEIVDESTKQDERVTPEKIVFQFTDSRRGGDQRSHSNSPLKSKGGLMMAKSIENTLEKFYNEMEKYWQSGAMQRGLIKMNP